MANISNKTLPVPKASFEFVHELFCKQRLAEGMGVKEGTNEFYEEFEDFPTIHRNAVSTYIKNIKNKHRDEILELRKNLVSRLIEIPSANKFYRVKELDRLRERLGERFHESMDAGADSRTIKDLSSEYRATLRQIGEECDELMPKVTQQTNIWVDKLLQVQQSGGDISREIGNLEEELKVLES